MTRSRRRVRWFHLLLPFFYLISTTHCVLPVCKNIRLQTEELALRRLWNALQHIKDRQQVKVWVVRFLDRLLAGTAFQLKESSGKYVIVGTDEASNVCQINVATQQQQLRDPNFLSKLYQLKQEYRLRLDSYMYTPAREFTTRGTQSQITGGNCNATNYRVNLSYWKSISTRYSQKYWQEACQLGQKLQRWEMCFSPELRALYRERMKRICQ